MSGRAAQLVPRLWEGEAIGWRALRGLLVPASALYGAVVVARNAAYRAGLLRAGTVAARTVSVGNVRVGGTGKTPLTRWLAQQAAARGVAVAIVSRGYGGTTRAAHVVGDGGRVASDVAASGDEAVMLARTAGVPVVAGRDRVAAATLAVETFGSRLLLCDDAFQHRRLRRDVDVVLIDGDEPGGLGRLLPAGPLREPLAGLARAHVLVVCERNAPAGAAARAVRPPARGGVTVHARFAPAALVRAPQWREDALAVLAGRRVLAVSGVARPAPFYGYLREWGTVLVHVLEYPDHHAYEQSDWQEIAHAAKDVDLVVTTEKDLVKLERFPFERDKLVALRIGVTIDDADALLRAVLGGTDAGRP
jgi:tetraacyldisaccharide 4'-kinase